MQNHLFLYTNKNQFKNIIGKRFTKTEIYKGMGK